MQHWRDGKSVVCKACAGAGKTTLIAHACACIDRSVIVLAYNRQLARDTRDALARIAPTSQCYTFHGLASHLFRATPDDDALRGVVCDLEAGVLTVPAHVACTAHVCVDEAQDLTPLHVRFLKQLFPNPAQFLIVGDEMQMLYDYHDNNPASLEFMRAPEEWCRSSGSWIRSALAESFRVSRNMATVANAALNATPAGTAPDGSAPFEGPCPTSVPKSAPRDAAFTGRGASSDPVDVVFTSDYGWYKVVAAVLNEVAHSDIVILTRTRRGNGPLTVLLNELSNRHGHTVPLHVHGSDSADKRAVDGKLRVLTWHSSKGTQAPVVIVLGATPTVNANAFHVALTRATRRLVVVQNEDDVHPAFSGECLEQLVRGGHVRIDRSRAHAVAAKRPPCRAAPAAPLALLNVDEWTGEACWHTLDACAHFDTCDQRDPTAEAVLPPADADASQTIRVEDRWEDVSATLCDATLVAVESFMSGACVRTLPSRQARRATLRDAVQYVSAGGQADITPHTPGPPLALDLNHVFRAACDRVQRTPRATVPCIDDCVMVAAGMRAWGGYHHQMRQVLPLSWTHPSDLRDDAMRLASFLHHAVGPTPTFHRRFHIATADGVVFGNAFAVGGGQAVRVVATPRLERVDMARAALLLSITPAREVSCVSIYNLHTHTCTRVTVDDREALFRCVNSAAHDDALARAMRADAASGPGLFSS